MPNINAKVKASVTAICGGKAATSAHIKTADAIFSSVGKVYHIDEDLFPAFGALGGASGAFVLMYIDALAEAGVRAGLARPIASPRRSPRRPLSAADFWQWTQTSIPSHL